MNGSWDGEASVGVINIPYVGGVVVSRGPSGDRMVGPRQPYDRIFWFEGGMALEFSSSMIGLQAVSKHHDRPDPVDVLPGR